MNASPTAYDSQDALEAPTEDALPLAAPVLAALKQRGSEFLLPADLEALLDARRETLFCAIDLLRARGYTIEFHPYFGLRLVDIPDRLLAAEVADSLNTRVVGSQLEVHDELGSTSDRAWELIGQDQAQDGAVILAEHQAHGRGRLGRTWTAPKGSSVLMSVVLKTAVPPERTPYLTAIGALAVAHTLRETCHLLGQIRWPNDVVVHGHKIAGVIVEARSDFPDTYVLGIGLNVHQARHDLPDSLQDVATSIRMESGERINRNRLVRYLLFYLDGLYQKLAKKKYRPIAALWRDYAGLLKREVLISDDRGEHRGVVTQCDPAEGFTIKPPSGQSQRIPVARIQSLRTLE